MNFMKVLFTVDSGLVCSGDSATLRPLFRVAIRTNRFFSLRSFSEIKAPPSPPDSILLRSTIVRPSTTKDGPPLGITLGRTDKDGLLGDMDGPEDGLVDMDGPELEDGGDEGALDDVGVEVEEGPKLGTTPTFELVEGW